MHPTYPALSYSYSNHRPNAVQPVVIDPYWSTTWPTIRSILLSFLMLISSAAIIGLEIANVAMEYNKENDFKRLGMDTSKVGAGIWCGSISFLAAIFIVVIVCVRNKRVAATFALIAVTLAFFFTIILVGLTANSIQRDQDLYDMQRRLIIAILSIALFILTQCLIFFLMYISVFFSSATRISSVYY
ncbi:unnamed protein product [Adineta ricciae]|uniref:Uncharacterized protein n=1 Tax=Adineta ricciae TaxID=249248 RepID=A0A814I216_ADIRI|nr:unnamed protein product [Adineta ricciae]